MALLLADFLFSTGMTFAHVPSQNRYRSFFLISLVEVVRHNVDSTKEEVRE